jgi:regulator of sigma E protease
VGSNLLIDISSLIEFMGFLPILLAKSAALSDILAPYWGYFQVALGLGFVIFVHELGHFLAAKTFGVRCDKFYVGFDVPISIGPIKLPSTLGKFKWGETEYGIGIIPLGGYVKMLGQDDDPRKAEEEAERVRAGGDALAPLDPRSYPAKPVWQRMIIISAGVIMNLIFAVIMAGVAYRYGVPYTPTVIGDTIGGGPAWQAGLQPGDKLLRVGSMSEDDPNLRFNDFRLEVAVSGLDKKGAAIPMTVLRGEERIEIAPLPTKDYDPDRQHFAIGVISPSSAKLGKTHPILPNSYLASSSPDLQPGDDVIAVDGIPLPVDSRFGQPLGKDLIAAFQAKWNQPVTLTVQRAGADKQSSTTVDVELPPVPVKTLGFDFKIGPISAIQKGSLAEKAGIKAGDTIVAMDGQTVDRSLELPSLIASKAGKSIELKVSRPTNAEDPKSTAASEQVFQLELPATPQFSMIAAYHGVMTLAELGIAYEVTNTISAVDSDLIGVDAFHVGDQLVQIHWEPSDEMKASLQEIYPKQGLAILLGNQVVDNSMTIPSIFDQLQEAPEQMNVRCYLKRDGKTVEQVAQLQYANAWYWPQRGLGLTALTDVHTVDSFTEAATLGAWETWRRFKEVLGFLRMLVTGKIGASGVGGPVAIFKVAGAEASHGVSRLLLFLTFLSANLAILNFLPIPALDGGHMMFLTAEAIRGKPVNEALQIRLTMAGVMCLLCLMAFVIIKDIMVEFL